MSEEQQRDTGLESIMSDILSHIAPLTEHEIEFPSNPWETNPEYVSKLSAAHELLDKIKQGAEIIVIAVDQKARDKTTVFSANMEPEEALVRLNTATGRFAKMILRREAKRRNGSSD